MRSFDAPGAMIRLLRGNAFFSSRPIRCLLVSLVVLATSCGTKTTLSGRIEGLSSDTLQVEHRLPYRTVPVETLVTQADGSFSCQLEIDADYPEFYGLTYQGKPLATLLVKKGDQLCVEADTVGNCRITGSEESMLLMESDLEYAKILARCNGLALRLRDLPQNTNHAASLRREYSENYIKLYRSSVRYIVEHNHSLTSIPVILRKFGDAPLFNQRLDGLHFRSLRDTLSMLYPGSPYLKLLQDEIDNRERLLMYQEKLDSMETVGFPDIELPDIRSDKVKLSAVEGKVVLLNFWSISDTANKSYNLDVLMPLYEKYHAKGLDIYQVALDTDKVGWAQIVMAQKMPWTSVCDIRGGASTYVALYNVTSLPKTYIISAGELYAEQPTDAASLRTIVASILK